LAGRDDGSVWTLNLEGEAGRTPTAHRLGNHGSRAGGLARVYAAAFAPGSQVAISAGSDRVVRRWNLRTGEQLPELTGHSGSVFSLDMGSNFGERLLVTASADGTARIWDWWRGTQLAVIAGHQGWVRGARLLCLKSTEIQCPTKDLGVITADDGGTLRVWSVGAAVLGPQEPTLVQEIRGHSDSIVDFGVDLRWRTVLTVSKDRTFRRWKVERPDVVTLRHDWSRTKAAAFARAPVPHPDESIFAAAASQSRLIATAGADQSVRLWRRQDDGAFTEAGVPGLFDTRVQLTTLAISQTTDCLAVPGYPRNTRVKLWKPGTGTPVKRDRPLEVSWDRLPETVEVNDSVTSLMFSEDGNQLAVATGDKIRIYDVDPRVCRWSRSSALDIPVGTAVLDVALSTTRSGVFLAAAITGGARVWQRRSDETGYRLVGDATGHVGQAEAIALNSDGSLMATGGEDTTVRLWQLHGEAPRLVGELLGHDQRVRALAFSRDGRFLATGGDDTVIRVWDVTARTEVQRITGHHGGIHSLSFLDDYVLLSASVDGTARLTPCDACGNVGAMARRALRRLARIPNRLTDVELESYAAFLR
jgi:WD40 repeat protein